MKTRATCTKTSVATAIDNVREALAEQREAVAEFRAVIAELSLQTAILENNMAGYDQTLGAIDTKPLKRRCRALADQADSWLVADMALAGKAA